MQVQAGMCRKSRVGENIVFTDAECDTHRKTPTKTMRNAEVNTFLHSAARRLGHFFAIKQRKNRCESRSKVQFRVSKVPKLEFQHMPAKESHNPAWRQTQRLPRTATLAAEAVAELALFSRGFSLQQPLALRCSGLWRSVFCVLMQQALLVGHSVHASGDCK